MVRVLLLLLAALLPVPFAFAQDAPESQEESGEVESAVVERRPFVVAISLDGVFEGEGAIPIAVRLEEWAELEVVEAVGHGERVEAGSVVVRFDTRGIDRAIEDLETELELGRLGERQLAEEVAVLRESVPFELGVLERAHRIASEDLERFLTVERPLAEKNAAYSLKSTRNELAYEKEEYEQLRKMYEADELTEETEEIILKRQRDVVEAYEIHLVSAQIDHDAELSIRLPRQEEERRAAVREAALALEKGRLTLRPELAKKELELEKARRALARETERLERLRRDRQAMAVVAARGGVVYYGRSVHGTWTDARTLEDALSPGGAVEPGAVLVTIVRPQALRFRAGVPEASLRWFRTGLAGRVIAAADPGRRIPAEVVAVSEFPVAPGVFEVELDVEPEEDHPVVPGMAGKARFVPYRVESALVVAAGAVFLDDLGDGGDVVYVRGEDGAASKRAVKVGARTGERFEILEGVEEGETVLLEEPK